jgi:hypothetical protein
MPADIWQIIGTSMVSFLLSFMLMKVWLPFAPRRQGEVLLQVHVQFIQRVMIHRNQAFWVLLFILAGSLPVYEQPWFLPGTQPTALAALFLIISLPLRYVFTDRGIGIGNTVPRPYRTFRRLDMQDVRQGRGLLATTTIIVLRGRKLPRGTAPSMTLYLPSSQAPAVIRLLKRHLR